ncbi:MAG: cytidyltransferase [Pseudomonadota bacterium]
MFATIAVTGRFQPFHIDHLDLVVHGLTLAERVIIGITNPDPRSFVALPENDHRHLTGANPFTYYERHEIVCASFEAADISNDKYTIVPFPIDVPEVWTSYIPQSVPQLVRCYSVWEEEKVRRFRDAGYETVVIHGNPSTKISGTDIRVAMEAGESWQQWICPGGLKVLREYSNEDLAARVSRK